MDEENLSSILENENEESEKNFMSGKSSYLGPKSKFSQIQQQAKIKNDINRIDKIL